MFTHALGIPAHRSLPNLPGMKHIPWLLFDTITKNAGGEVKSRDRWPFYRSFRTDTRVRKVCVKPRVNRLVFVPVGTFMLKPNINFLDS